jgi:cytochrome c biogenesis protein CcmG/thiol:disulfide interchange protein DsbE
MKAIYFVPIVLFLLLVLFFEVGLGRDPSLLPSSLINQPSPKFSSVSLDQQKITDLDFKGHITLLNVWASWCDNCQLEHPIWMDVASEDTFALSGLNYKDDVAQANLFLTKFGNPYSKIIYDPNGLIAMKFGVYGTPETFIIDSRGIVRYRHVGYLTREVWEKTLLPLIHHLEKQHV